MEMYNEMIEMIKAQKALNDLLEEKINNPKNESLDRYIEQTKETINKIYCKLFCNGIEI